MHFAAESHVDRSILGAADFVMTNVRRHPDAARRRRCEHGVDKFVHVSTDEVYGSIETGSWDEEQPLRAQLAVLRVQGLLATCSPAPTTAPTACRCASPAARTTTGPYQFPEKVIPLFVTNLIDGATVPLYGEGANVRDWLHVDDHCRGIELVLTGGRPGEVYNIGGGTELTNKELTGLLLEATGTGLGRASSGSTDRLGPRPALLGRHHQDPRRARLPAAGAVRAGPGRHRRVVPRPPRLVGAAQAAGPAARVGKRGACGSVNQRPRFAPATRDG